MVFFEKMTMEILFCIAVLSTWIASAKAIAPTSSFHHGNREIGLFREHVTYETAEEECRSWGGGLVILDTNDLQRDVVDHIRSMNIFDESEWARDDPFDPGFYVGAHDQSEEGSWRWRDSKSVPHRGSNGFHKWGPSEPNNYGVEVDGVGEDCMFILMMDAFPEYGYSAGTWMDSDCFLKKFYICEREVVKPSLKRTGSLQFLDRLIDAKCSDRVVNGLVELPPHSHKSCDDVNINYVIGWDAFPPDYKWMTKYTGNHIEITTFPRRSLKSRVQNDKLFVDKIIIKWQSGSQAGSRHSFGGHRRAAEIQILHEDHPTLGRIGFSFLVKERHNPPNGVWQDILTVMTRNRNIGAEAMLSDPPTLESILSDTDDVRGRHPRHILNRPIRYELEADEQCGKVTWFVFPRMVHLSTSQLTLLRGMQGFKESQEKFLRPKKICQL